MTKTEMAKEIRRLTKENEELLLENVKIRHNVKDPTSKLLAELRRKQGLIEALEYSQNVHCEDLKRRCDVLEIENDELKRKLKEIKKAITA